jgi:hypothetical protein
MVGPTGPPKKGRNAGTFAALKSRHFRLVENMHNFASNVSSRELRRNNSPAQETIFCFSSRHPETQRH